MLLLPFVLLTNYRSAGTSPVYARRRRRRCISMIPEIGDDTVRWLTLLKLNFAFLNFLFLWWKLKLEDIRSKKMEIEIEFVSISSSSICLRFIFCFFSNPLYNEIIYKHLGFHYLVDAGQAPILSCTCNLLLQVKRRVA